MALTWIPLVMALGLISDVVAQDATAPASRPEPQDAYLWLEEVAGSRALAWVKERNAESVKELADSPGFAKLEYDLLAILDSNARILDVEKHGDDLYNFWRDADNPRGIWRRTTLDEYREPDPKWDVVLDLDAVAQTEGENWVWGGAGILRPGRRALVSLSRGGTDADVIREYDLATRSFVEDGFVLPESKGVAIWIDVDHLYVSRDFGPGTLTTAGYPRVVKLWARGTPLSGAKTIYEGQPTDIWVFGFVNDNPGFERQFIRRMIAPGRDEIFLRKAGALERVDLPHDSMWGVFRDWLVVALRTSWTVAGGTYQSGALLVTPFDGFMAGKRDFAVLFEPTSGRSLADWAWTRHHLILNVLDDVKSSLTVATPGPLGWQKRPLSGAPPFSTVAASALDPDESDEYLLQVSGYLTPTGLLYGRVGQPPEMIKQLPAFFDASGLEVSQHFATSKDGTRVPYFQVSPKAMRLDGTRPTLLFGYGGFEVSLTPTYDASVGRGWLSEGGVFAVANIRGGGEYGPRWHQAAVKENRGRVYEDFAAVAEDLIARKVTSPEHLGIRGESNGGLLVGNMLTLYPKLFGAIVCQVPLLDMKRYSHLSAGAVAIDEYGNPDKPEEWAFLRPFSPYHNVKKDAEYPPVLFTTSTRDDRVHPGHARKMMALMRDMGHDVHYYESLEGGHAGAASSKDRAYLQALAFSFLWRELK